MRSICEKDPQCFYYNGRCNQTKPENCKEHSVEFSCERDGRCAFYENSVGCIEDSCKNFTLMSDCESEDECYYYNKRCRILKADECKDYTSNDINYSSSEKSCLKHSPECNFFNDTCTIEFSQNCSYYLSQDACERDPFCRYEDDTCTDWISKYREICPSLPLDLCESAPCKYSVSECIFDECTLSRAGVATGCPSNCYEIFETCAANDRFVDVCSIQFGGIFPNTSYSYSDCSSVPNLCKVIAFSDSLISSVVNETQTCVSRERQVAGDKYQYYNELCGIVDNCESFYCMLNDRGECVFDRCYLERDGEDRNSTTCIEGCKRVYDYKGIQYKCVNESVVSDVCSLNYGPFYFSSEVDGNFTGCRNNDRCEVVTLSQELKILFNTSDVCVSKGVEKDICKRFGKKDCESISCVWNSKKQECVHDICLNYTTNSCPEECKRVYDLGCINKDKYIDVCSSLYGGILFNQPFDEAACANSPQCEFLFIPDLIPYFKNKETCVSVNRYSGLGSLTLEDIECSTLPERYCESFSCKWENRKCVFDECTKNTSESDRMCPVGCKNIDNIRNSVCIDENKISDQCYGKFGSIHNSETKTVCESNNCVYLDVSPIYKDLGSPCVTDPSLLERNLTGEIICENLGEKDCESGPCVWDGASCVWDVCLDTMTTSCPSECKLVLEQGKYSKTYGCFNSTKYVDVCSLEYGGIFFNSEFNSDLCVNNSLCELIDVNSKISDILGHDKICVNKKHHTSGDDNSTWDQLCEGFDEIRCENGPCVYIDEKCTFDLCSTSSSCSENCKKIKDSEHNLDVCMSSSKNEDYCTLIYSPTFNPDKLNNEGCYENSSCEQISLSDFLHPFLYSTNMCVTKVEEITNEKKNYTILIISLSIGIGVALLILVTIVVVICFVYRKRKLKSIFLFLKKNFEIM
jgi:hypothetical protein